jgi:hypothetical protein
MGETVTIELITLAKSKIDLLVAENEYMSRKLAHIEVKSQTKIKCNLDQIERLQREIIELSKFYL